MGWFEATLVFILGIITFAVILPVAEGLLPFMRDTMGQTVVTMVSAMLIIILVLAFLIYVRQSQEPDSFGMMGENQF